MPRDPWADYNQGFITSDATLTRVEDKALAKLQREQALAAARPAPDNGAVFNSIMAHRVGGAA